MSEGRVTLMYGSTDNMIADVMTKPINKLKLDRFAGALSGD